MPPTREKRFQLAHNDPGYEGRVLNGVTALKQTPSIAVAAKENGVRRRKKVNIIELINSYRFL